MNLINKEKYTPILIKDNLAYMRKEKNGLMISSKYLINQYPIFLNRSAEYIINNCDGSNSLDRIYELMWDKYEIQSEYDFKKDVDNLLFTLWKIGLIKWESENPFRERNRMIVGDYIYQKVDIDSFDEFIKKFDDNAFVSFQDPTFSSNYFDDESYIKLSFINNLVGAYLLKRNDVEFANLLIGYEHSDFIINIYKLNIKEELFENSLKEMKYWLEWVCSQVNDLFSISSPNYKYNIFSLQCEKDDINNISVLQKIGFKEVGVLSKEVNDTDIILYTYDTDE